MEIIPVNAEASGLVIVDVPYEIPHVFRVECSVLVSKGRVLRNHRRSTLTGCKVNEFSASDLDAGCLSVLDKHIVVDKFLPGRIADLFLSLLVLY